MTDHVRKELDRLYEIEKSRPLDVSELVAKGRCLQVSDGDEQTLREAEQTLLQAVRLDPEYVPAMLELGWYYLNVSDNPARAEPWFKKSRELLRDLMTDAVVGEARCAGELRSKSAAIDVLRNATVVDRDRLRQELEECRHDA